MTRGKKAKGDPSEVVVIGYTNYKGEFAKRRILPLKIQFGASRHHKGSPQWFLLAYDYNRAAERNFAIKDISSWTPEEPETETETETKDPQPLSEPSPPTEEPQHA
jgi:predicted DNA-binding transcriptional regulator YafY